MEWLMHFIRRSDTLSPDLFKIFINDLTDIFDEEYDGVSLGHFKIDCLMYADDVILISKSERGLKKCLTKLENYCDLWCLDINIDKTKTIVFNKSGRILQYSFYFSGHSIKNVQTYKYLSVLFSASGTFSHAKLDLYKRGLKAFFKLKCIYGDISSNVNTSLHIFDHTVKKTTVKLAHGSRFMVHGSRFAVHGSRFTIHGSRFTIHGSRFTIRSSRFTIHGSRFAVHGSRFTVHGSRFTVHGSRFTVHGSRFTVHGSRSAVHGSRLAVHGSRFTVHGSRSAVHGSRFAGREGGWGGWREGGRERERERGREGGR